ncbi:MAG TPA: transglutaminase domain-containing protein [Kofleriaceae bacterium]|nr:transglutaminase domain-containing protein [Kofleriaceae bacterium]
MSHRRSPHSGRAALVAGLALVAGGVGAFAVAQGTAPKRVLHEDLPGPGSSGPLLGDVPRPGQNPAGFASGNKILPEPSHDAPGSSDPVLGRGGFAADRQTSTRPDLNTGSDGTLHYISVFNPDVLPFKRMSAMDGVRDDETLFISRTALVELPVGGTTDQSRDRFWGSVVVQLAPGVDAPLPSVAPDMRILSYETEPPINLTFSKDGADNFYVRSDEASAHGEYRLVFLVDADAGYFAPALPTGQRYTAAMVRRMAPPEIIADLPEGVRRSAERSLRELGIDDHTPLPDAFNKLVYYFRGFTAKDPPSSTGDIYRDLFTSQAGVCRHRSFAFMITANALGIPTRYVQNEAHAFAEVWFPERGWQRIDLGGAALRMDVEGADGKTLHRPRAEDPFAKPDAYKDSYTQLEGDIHGLSDKQLADRKQPLGNGSSSGDYSALVQGDGSGSGGGSGSGSSDAIGPGSGGPPHAMDPHKITPTITITNAGDSGYRGETLHVEGRVDENQHPLAGKRVDIYLAPQGRQGEGATLIGHGVTSLGGTFNADVDLPPTLDLQTYELYLGTPEDDRYNAAFSN